MGCSCAAPAGASMPAAAATTPAATSARQSTPQPSGGDAVDGAEETKVQPAGTGGSGASTARRGVLLIGDSLSVGTKPHFTEALAGQPVEVNATGGISLAEGMRRYRATANKPRVVEMALFTNNSPGQQEALRQAIEETIADARERGGKVVWATIVRPGGYERVNDMIREYAAKHPDVMGLVDWAKMVAEHPNYLAGDRIHGTTAGYRARAQAFADAAK